MWKQGESILQFNWTMTFLGPGAELNSYIKVAVLGWKHE